MNEGRLKQLGFVLSKSATRSIPKFFSIYTLDPRLHRSNSFQMSTENYFLSLPQSQSAQTSLVPVVLQLVAGIFVFLVVWVGVGGMVDKITLGRLLIYQSLSDII
ncbi:hypothetical protein B0H12DRAFT_1126497 [Mycena haematopus]|nr:hypothetical protein B0H12DRAFT_1126497 [Mycena haematopus]